MKEFNVENENPENQNNNNGNDEESNNPENSNFLDMLDTFYKYSKINSVPTSGLNSTHITEDYFRKQNEFESILVGNQPSDKFFRFDWKDDDSKYSIVRLARLFLLDKSATLSVRTIKYYRSYLGDFVAYLLNTSFGIRSVYELTDRIMILYIDRVSSMHNPGGRAAALRPIKVFLNWVDKQGDERPPEWRNPAYKITKLRAPLPDVRVTSDEEVKSFFSTFKTDSFYDIRDILFFLILVKSGARASEILSIRKSRVDLERKKIMLLETKGSKPRYIFIDDSVVAAYKKLQEFEKSGRDELFLSIDGKPLKYAGIRQLILRRAKKAGLDKPPSMHAFRRRFVVKLLSDDMPTETIRLILGHSSLRVIESYSRFSSHDLENAYQKHSSSLLPDDMDIPTS